MVYYPILEVNPRFSLFLIPGAGDVMTIKKRVEQYLKEQGLFYEAIDLDRFVKDFHHEMEKGLKADASSLAMIATYIEGNPEIPRGRKVIVLDAGGTNLRAALVSFDQSGEPVIENFRKRRMPGYDREVSKEEFYGIMVDHFAEFADQADSIGFCFSYPAEIQPDKDAIPTLFTKEIKASEVLGESIRDNLHAMLKSKGLKADHKVVVLNDTVATLLTGMSSRPGREYDGYVGYILGTGLNGCYLEKNKRIPKVDIKDDKSQVINTECGCFAHFPRGKADKDFDATTVCPGNYYLEKVSSGGYFGPLCSVVLQEAVEKDLFSDKAAAALKKLPVLKTLYPDNFLHNPQEEKNPLVEALKEGSEEDREILYWLIDGLLERAAKVIAGSLAALVLRNEGGHSPLHPVCLTVDGTTFYAYKNFRSRVESYLDAILVDKHQRYYEIIRVEDAPLLGAAIAALTN